MREYLEELSSATFVAIWGVVATIPGKSASLHSSSGQERQEGGGELSICYLSCVVPGPGLRGDGSCWRVVPPALGPDRMYICLFAHYNTNHRRPLLGRAVLCLIISRVVF